MYQFRYNSLCIPKSVSIQIQLSLHSKVCINPDTTCSKTLYSLNENYNNLDCINLDTTFSVFLSMYQPSYNCSRTLYSLDENYNTLVCINLDTTLSVFLSMYQSRYNLLSNSILSTLYQSRYNSLSILQYVSIQIQLALYS